MKKINNALLFLQNKVLNVLYDMVTNDTFEMAILGIIVLNMVVMMWQHYGQSQMITNALHILCQLTRGT